jgi:hypothetical protein
MDMMVSADGGHSHESYIPAFIHYSSIQNYAENVKKFRLFDLVYIGRLNFASPFVRAFFHRRSTESSPQHTLKPLSAHW